MTRESKKERELGYLRLFQRLCAEAPQSQPEASERPDFAFHTSEGLIGIEVTEYYRPHVPNPNLRHSRPLQEQDALKNTIVERAREIFESKHGIRARVQLLFRPLEVVDRSQVDALASSISDLIGGFQLTSEHQRFQPTRDVRFPTPLTTVFAQTVPEQVVPRWEVVAAGEVRRLTSSHLLEMMRDKEAKLDRYRQDLSQTWLLIVQDYWSRASYGELSEEAALATYSSRFHRVFFLRVFQGQCIALNVAYIASPRAT